MDFTQLRALSATAVASGTVPGLVVAVGRGGDTVFLESFGQRRLVPSPLPASTDTIYDLASLTKAIGTSVLAMQAIGEDRLTLDDELSACLPELVPSDAPLAAATVRHLLCHAAGLPAHRRFFERGPASAPREALATAAIVALAAREPLAFAPGARSVYSDLGFILLGAIVERRLDAALAAAFRERIAGPLGLRSLGYRPLDTTANVDTADDIAATETCPVRQRTITGEVHDLNAWAMGGVAGHAGLFGHAADVAAIAAALCRIFRGASALTNDLVDPDVLRTFFSPCGVPGSTWRLGWDGRSAQGSLAGTRISMRAVGHLGFTGCSLWIDPDREAFVVMLSNRIHPVVRDDPAFRALRPAVMDAALSALD
jgi:CubicO group peptidase (beta-lactamase class C family)